MFLKLEPMGSELFSAAHRFVQSSTLTRNLGLPELRLLKKVFQWKRVAVIKSWLS